jgi:restriction system protein
MRERIAVGDLVALPLKSRAAIALGRITGRYTFDPSAPYDAKHQRPVSWIRTDTPRNDIDQDILFSLGSTLAVFQVRRNDAERRLLALAQGQSSPPQSIERKSEAQVDEEAGSIDLDEYARDQITQFIARTFKGHELARLVAGVLSAQGYTVEVSPPGADGGVDIIAGQGPMGFDQPRLIVQVKSSESPVDVGVLRELQGVIPSFGGDRGLIVAWGGFKTSVIKEARRLFFSIRLWDAGDLVAALQNDYDRLSPELQAEIPLRRLWALTLPEQG